MRETYEISATAENKASIWEVALSFLLDNEEASIVRENAAGILTNLCSHMVTKGNVCDLCCVSF